MKQIIVEFDHAFGDIRQVIMCSNHGCKDKMSEYTYLLQKLGRITYKLDIQPWDNVRLQMKSAPERPSKAWNLNLPNRELVNNQVKNEIRKK